MDCDLGQFLRVAMSLEPARSARSQPSQRHGRRQNATLFLNSTLVKMQ